MEEGKKAPMKGEQGRGRRARGPRKERVEHAKGRSGIRSEHRPWVGNRTDGKERIQQIGNGRRRRPMRSRDVLGPSKAGKTIVVRDREGKPWLERLALASKTGMGEGIPMPGKRMPMPGVSAKGGNADDGVGEETGRRM
jgi:hypothetical protein